MAESTLNESLPQFPMDKKSKTPLVLFIISIIILIFSAPIGIISIQKLNKSKISFQPKTEMPPRSKDILGESADPKPTQSPEVLLTVTEIPEQSGKITLKGTATSGGINFTWSTSGFDPISFKLLRSPDPNPKFPNNEARTFEANEKSYLWEILDGQVWHFRVCHYNEGYCSVYSNDIEVKAQQYKQ